MATIIDMNCTFGIPVLEHSWTNSRDRMSNVRLYIDCMIDGATYGLLRLKHHLIAHETSLLIIISYLYFSVMDSLQRGVASNASVFGSGNVGWTGRCLGTANQLDRLCT
jgi:hypothetical protein